MATGPTIVAKFTADASGLKNEVDDASSKAGSSITNFGKKAALAIGGAFAVGKIIDFGKQSINAASDLSESISKVGVVFGDSAGDIEAWASTAATSMGMSEQAALAAAGTYGNLAVALGLPQETAADMSKSLVGLAGDLASFNNVPVDDALQALQSGLTGETEPLKKFGVNLNAATIEAEAMALGLYDGTGTLDAAAKAQASYSLILKQTTTAQGDFSRTSDGLANQQKIATAQIADMQAELGTALLPILTKVTGFLTQYVIPALSALATYISENISWLGPLAVAIGVASAAIWVMNAALAANPISLIILAVAALVAGIIALYQNCEVFRTIVDAAFAAVATAFGWITDAAKAVFNWVKDNWPLLLAILTGPIGAAVLIIVKNWDTVKDAATSVFEWVKGKWDAIAAAISWAVGLISGYVNTVIAVWGTLKDAATSVWSWVTDKWNLIVSAISSAVTSISGYMASIVTAIKTPMDAATAVYDWVKGKFDALASAIAGVLDGITSSVTSIVSAIKAPINAVIKAWNGLEFKIPSITLPEFDTHIPGVGKVGGGTVGGNTIGFPDIPLLAKGGLLTQPTLFVGGEAGREIVTPETLMRRIVAEESGGGDTYVLNLYPRTADASDVAYGFRRLELLAGVV